MRIYGSPPSSNHQSVGEDGLNLVIARRLVMNRTKLPLIINWSGIQGQIQVCMLMLASISTTTSRRSSQMCSCFQRLGAWSVMRHKWPSKSWHALWRDPSADLSLLSLGRFAKVLRLVGHNLEQSLCCACHMSIAYSHAKPRSQVSQLNQHIFSIFRFRVASISEQCAVSLWF